MDPRIRVGSNTIAIPILNYPLTLLSFSSQVTISYLYSYLHTNRIHLLVKPHLILSFISQLSYFKTHLQ